MTPTEVAYRKTAVEGASGFGLLIALYDTLAGNLRRGAAAQRANDIEMRSREIKHALTVIAYLEDCVQRGAGGELAESLTSFYRKLRRRIMDAQVKQSAEALENQMRTVLRIRENWQMMDLRNPALENAELSSAEAIVSGGVSQRDARNSYGWSG